MCERKGDKQNDTKMSLKVALETLDLLRPGGGGYVIDLQKYPRAIGMMGLPPFAVEARTADACRQVVDEYLAEYPEADRERIRADMWRDYDDIQRYKASRIDLRFLDEEFGKLNKDA